MNLNHHRRAAARVGVGRKAVRFGLLATAGLTAMATAATTAQAAGPGSTAGTGHGVAIANDSAHALANPGNRVRFDDSFTVHQEGTVFAAAAHNLAEADSAGCTAARPCRSVALSFQIVTMAGENIHLNAVNSSNAANHHCAGCQTLAGAYQFIVSTPRAFRLSPTALRQLADIHRRLDALGRSKAPVATVKTQADALAAQVTSILQAAAATAPKGPGIDALAVRTPTVTVHRMYTG
ncbi:hypothetical protein ACEZCY_32240 [Streptacidiphilus sp. N1-12]|uniref:Uncharacterized protein n=2 Tax=Streptacidiphilus alkalitolerans TaxID=3342712 RepID=A0ABV6VJB2_9ACTN